MATRSGGSSDPPRTLKLNGPETRPGRRAPGDEAQARSGRAECARRAATSELLTFTANVIGAASARGLPDDTRAGGRHRRDEQAPTPQFTGAGRCANRSSPPDRVDPHNASPVITASTELWFRSRGRSKERRARTVDSIHEAPPEGFRIARCARVGTLRVGPLRGGNVIPRRDVPTARSAVQREMSEPSHPRSGSYRDRSSRSFRSFRTSAICPEW